MPSLAVVFVDPLCDFSAGLRAGGEVFLAQQLPFQRGVERFADRVVEGRSGASHGLGDPGATAGVDEELAGVLTALVRVKPNSV